MHAFLEKEWLDLSDVNLILSPIQSSLVPSLEMLEVAAAVLHSRDVVLVCLSVVSRPMCVCHAGCESLWLHQ